MRLITFNRRRDSSMNAYLINNKTTETSSNYTPIDYINKPIIIYYFINPFCHTCWNIEPILKKITMEYGAFCSIRPVIIHSPLIPQSNRFENNHTIHSLSSSEEYSIAIAIKAAALQGNKTGRDYLRNVQESLFLYNKSSVKTIIRQASEHTNIDVHEFENDLFSVSAKKAFQSDLELAQEMEVKQFPTFVFLSQHIEDYSMKVSGAHSYETYTFIIGKMLESEVMKKTSPSFDDFFKLYKRFHTEEIAFVFDIPIKEAENNLKKLQLRQKVKKIEQGQNSFWEVCNN